ncbi:hypothetical protein ZWY2020_049283 [Hordeum vulgare]|nr:hypothetical protein ZWY2020_049283 [Hordeum vulgare]
MSVVPFGVTLLLLFARPIPELAETIRAALLDALAHYRPVASRLAAEGDGELLRIEGAAARVRRRRRLRRRRRGRCSAASSVPGEICRHTDPLLLVQFAAAPSPAVPLRTDDGSLPRLPHSMVAAQKRVLSCVFNRDLALLDVTVPASLIGCVRAEFDAARLGDPCTVFESVELRLCGDLSLTIVSVSDEAPVLLSFSANVCRLVGARHGYYGNCKVVQSLTATRGAVAHGTAADVARLIRRAMERVPEWWRRSQRSPSVAGESGRSPSLP